MRRVVALLAAVALATLAGCGGDGAEPGASREATVVLDFTPNAVHAPIYAAADVLAKEKGAPNLHVQVPGATTDAAKLLAGGKADLAVMDISDLAIARERGADLVGISPLVDQPLAAVLANRDAPRNLNGATIGVTGVPSDGAVLDTVLHGLGTPTSAVHKITIGFQAVSSLAAGKVDAATAFRNAEGVELQRRGMPIRTLPVERYGAPPYPELVLVATRDALDSEAATLHTIVDAITAAGRHVRAVGTPGLAPLLTANPDLNPATQRAELAVIRQSLGHQFNESVLRSWARWAAAHGIVKRAPDVGQTFVLGPRQRLK